MKIIDIAKKHPPFDKPDGEAAWLISQGGFVEYVEPTFNDPIKPAPILIWWVAAGVREGDFIHPPALWYRCPACGNKGFTSSHIGTAHKTAKVFHCGLKGVVCPDEVQQEYVREFAKWDARHSVAWKRRQAAAAKAAKQGPGFDAGNPNHVMPLTPAQRALGMKTHEELLDTARSANVR